MSAPASSGQAKPSLTRTADKTTFYVSEMRKTCKNHDNPTAYSCGRCGLDCDGTEYCGCEGHAAAACPSKNPAHYGISGCPDCKVRVFPVVPAQVKPTCEATRVRQRCMHCIKQRDPKSSDYDSDFEGCGFCIDGFITRQGKPALTRTSAKTPPNPKPTHEKLPVPLDLDGNPMRQCNECETRCSTAELGDDGLCFYCFTAKKPTESAQPKRKAEDAVPVPNKKARAGESEEEK